MFMEMYLDEVNEVSKAAQRLDESNTVVKILEKLLENLLDCIKNFHLIQDENLEINQKVPKDDIISKQIVKDDILIFSKKISEHIEHPSKLFEAIKIEGFRLKFMKCRFAADSVKYMYLQF